MPINEAVFSLLCPCIGDATCLHSDFCARTFGDQPGRVEWVEEGSDLFRLGRICGEEPGELVGVEDIVG